MFCCDIIPTPVGEDDEIFTAKIVFQWRIHFPSVLHNTALECVGTTICMQNIEVYGTLLSSMPFFTLKTKSILFNAFPENNGITAVYLDKMEEFFSSVLEGKILK